MVSDWGYLVQVLCLFCCCPTSEAYEVEWTNVGRGWVLSKGHNSAWPTGRTEAATWMDPAGSLWMFGGHGYSDGNQTGFLNDLWRYDHNRSRWYSILPTDVKNRPSSRHGASACGVPGLIFVVHGGLVDGGYGLSPTWIYSMSKNKWITLQNITGPSNRGRAATWCTTTHMYVFGGVDRKQLLPPEMWRFSLRDLNWTKLDVDQSTDQNKSAVPHTVKPPGRASAVTWVDKNNKILYLFGGTIQTWLTGGERYASDLWAYNIDKNEWTKLSDSGGSVGAIKNRRAGVGWTRSIDNQIWLYSGEVLFRELQGTKNRMVLNRSNHYHAYVGDVWVFDVGNKRWYSKAGKTMGIKSVSSGNPSIAGNDHTPGARAGSSGWVYEDMFFMFGGESYSSGRVVYKNDLWYISLKPDGPFVISAGTALIVVFSALALLMLFVVVAVISRGRNHSGNDTKYSLLSNDSDMFDT